MTKSAQTIVKDAREAFNSGKTRDYSFRLEQLKGLLKFVADNEQRIIDILSKENKKPKFEAYISEIIQMKTEIKEAINNLKQWMAPSKVVKPLPNIMDKAEILPEPYGVVLIVGPWNYPVSLIISPLVGAIAAGNCAVLKPSEVTPLTAQFLEDTLSTYIDPRCYYVYNGGIPETTALLEQRFDYIFYTGSTAVGKIVYRAAAKHLTPVTLELGGKSPVYIDDSADVEIAAARIMWGKCLNSGQSCLEPDYLLCSEFIRDKFIKAAKNTIKKWYGEKIQQSPDYCRIINDNHFKRITKLLEGAHIAFGGHTDSSDRFIEPTILIDVKPDDPIMQDELFAPILPIITVETPEAAIEFINQREKPLAVYVFSTSKIEQNKFITGTYSGAICVNDVMMHYSCHTLPFGGVGNSGIGQYHGHFSFETFSHKKATLVKSLNRVGEHLQKVRYPPYTEKNLKRIASLASGFSGLFRKLKITFSLFLFIAFIAYITQRK